MEGPEIGLQGAEEKMRSGEAEAGGIENTFKIQREDLVTGSWGGPGT